MIGTKANFCLESRVNIANLINNIFYEWGNCIFLSNNQISQDNPHHNLMHLHIDLNKAKYTYQKDLLMNCIVCESCCLWGKVASFKSSQLILRLLLIKLMSQALPFDFVIFSPNNRIYQVREKKLRLLWWLTNNFSPASSFSLHKQ